MKSWAGYILAALGFVIYGAATEADRDGSGAIIGEGSVDAFQVQVGDCFNDTDSTSDEISSVPGVPCSEAHDNEAFAAIDLTIEEYPGADAMWALANESCMQHFEGYVGRDYESSSLDIISMYPSPDSWNQDDREVICSVYDMTEEKLVGSVKGLGL